MNANYARFAVAWLLIIGAACSSSAPIRYYTLTPPSDPSLRTTPATPPIDVRVVHIPSQLNRSELMVRTGPAESAVLENERWASPLKDEIKDAVRLELHRRLGGVSGLSSVALDIDVQRFEAQLGRYVLLEASWTANLSAADQPLGAGRVKTCGFRADEEIHSGYAGMVEGYQREIAALADAIAAVLASSATGIDVACQASI